MIVVQAIVLFVFVLGLIGIAKSIRASAEDPNGPFWKVVYAIVLPLFILLMIAMCSQGVPIEDRWTRP